MDWAGRTWCRTWRRGLGGALQAGRLGRQASRKQESSPLEEQKGRAEPGFPGPRGAASLQETEGSPRCVRGLGLEIPQKSSSHPEPRVVRRTGGQGDSSW